METLQWGKDISKLGTDILAEEAEDEFSLTTKWV